MAGPTSQSADPPATGAASTPFGMRVHPVADLLPLLGGDEFLELSWDIQNHGLISPIVVHDGQIIDGRNRLLACKDAGVQPRFAEWRSIYQGPMTVARWIWSVNVERRHLTLEQILAIEVALKGWEQKEAARQAGRVEAGRKAVQKGADPKSDSLETNRSQGTSLAACRAENTSGAPGAEATSHRDRRIRA